MKFAQIETALCDTIKATGYSIEAVARQSADSYTLRTDGEVQIEFRATPDGYAVQAFVPLYDEDSEGAASYRPDLTGYEPQDIESFVSFEEARAAFSALICQYAFWCP